MILYTTAMPRSFTSCSKRSPMGAKDSGSTSAKRCSGGFKLSSMSSNLAMIVLQPKMPKEFPTSENLGMVPSDMSM